MGNTKETRLLEEFYFGNIDPNTEPFNRNNPLQKATILMTEIEDELMNLLEGKEKKLFIELMKTHYEINGTTSVEKFIKGFKIGARMGLEILSDEDGYLQDIT